MDNRNAHREVRIIDSLYYATLSYNTKTCRSDAKCPQHGEVVYTLIIDISNLSVDYNIFSPDDVIHQRSHQGSKFGYYPGSTGKHPVKGSK